MQQNCQYALSASLYEFTNQRKATTTKSTTQTKDETEQKIDENPATEKKNSCGGGENFKNVDEIEIEGNNKDFEKMALKVRKSRKQIWVPQFFKKKKNVRRV